MPSLADITIDPSIRTRLQQGHPWVYRNHLIGAERLPSGQWVRARCGGLTVYGLYDAHSPIGLRIFSRNGPPDQAWFRDRVWEAWELRAPLRASGQTTAYRWIYGEGDGLPGIVVDRYGDYAVIQIYAESVQTLAPVIASALRAADPDLRGVVQARASMTMMKAKRSRCYCGGNGRRAIWWCKRMASCFTLICSMAKRPVSSSISAITGAWLRHW
ncbi:MAG: hypothetical protein N2385_05415 [Chloroflexus sp.]|nr:hypothetical protein [Chloroflexus sp.]